MPVNRIAVSALLGGTIMFIWGALSHMVLPIGDMGVRSLPGEQMILPAMKFSITERGFYMFPGMAELDGKDMSEEDQKVWADKYKAGPRGILVFDPTGDEAMSPRQLGTEFASNIVASLLLAIVLSQVRGSRGKRIIFAALLGVFAWMSIDVSYWNWYRFPTMFMTAQLIDQGVGWLLAGVAIALGLGRDRPLQTGAAW